jgi:hypothetical protein
LKLEKSKRDETYLTCMHQNIPLLLRALKLKALRASHSWIFKSRRLTLLAFCALLASGCSGPLAKPSPLMQKTQTPVAAPPAGKSLVLIHRPRQQQGYGLYTGVWDGTNLLADLGNGHSVAYVCEPGTHYFINRSVERVGVVEAQLLPNQVYGLWINIAGAWIASFQIEPIKRGGKIWNKAQKWEKDAFWVVRAPKADEHEKLRKSEIELILSDFVSGEKKDRLRHLGPEDHR